MKRNNIIPLAAAEKILKKEGAQRVSERATKIFVDYLESVAEDISRKAIRMSAHAGRKTVKENDIKLAIK